MTNVADDIVGETEASEAAVVAPAEAPSSAEGTSYRQILRSSSIVGGASVLNIVIGLARTKAAAVLLGPTGVGLIGLLQNLMATASTVSGMGYSRAGTRQIAEANGRQEGEAVAAARRGLFWGTIVLAGVGAVVFWLLRGVLARNVLGNADMAGEVGWLAIGVGLAVASGSQSALLTGLRRIGDIARVSVYSALLSTFVGVGSLWLWGHEAVIAFVLGAPMATFVLGHMFVARLPKIEASATPFPQLAAQWRMLTRLGVAFMAASLAATVGQLAVRTLVQHELGTEALGYFQAAWMISMTYISFVLTAMGQDYYPRLTAVIHKTEMANRMVNEQIEVAMLLSAPVLLAMLALIPWIIDLLYSVEFAQATNVLRWQVLGDVLKVVSWPLGIVVLATGDGRAYLMMELLSIGFFVCMVWLFLPYLGLEATGIAFLGMYIIYLPMVYSFARMKTGFRWARGLLRQLIVICLVSIIISAATFWFERLGAAVGVLASMAFGVHSLGRLGSMVKLPGPAGRLSLMSRRLWLKLEQRNG